MTDPAEAQAVLGRAASAKTVGIALEKNRENMLPLFSMGSEITGAAFAFSHDGKEEVEQGRNFHVRCEAGYEKLPGVQTGECL